MSTPFKTTRPRQFLTDLRSTGAIARPKPAMGPAPGNGLNDPRSTGGGR